MNWLNRDCLSSSLANCPQLPAILRSHLTFRKLQMNRHFILKQENMRTSKHQHLVYFLFYFNAHLTSSHRLTRFALKEKHHQMQYSEDSCFMFLQQFPFKKIKFSARRFDTHAFSSTLREKKWSMYDHCPWGMAIWRTSMLYNSTQRL